VNLERRRQAIARMLGQLGECRELYTIAYEALHRPVDPEVPREERDLVVQAMPLLQLLGERAYLLDCERLAVVPNADDRRAFLQGWTECFDGSPIGGDA
jgi:hypothetical protein